MSVPHVTTKRGRKPGSRTKGKTKTVARRTVRRKQKGQPDPNCGFCHGLGHVDKDYDIVFCECRYRS